MYVNILLANCNNLRELLKDVSISVLVLLLLCKHAFLNPADDSVILSLVGNVIPLIVSKQKIIATYVHS